MKSTFRLDDIRLDTTSAEFAAPPGASPPGAGARSTPKRRQRFTIVPQAWSERLREARHLSTYRVALFLLYRHWWTKGRPVKLSNVAMAAEGVPRREKWRALADLERLGLVAVERRPKKSPVVTVLFADYETQTAMPSGGSGRS
jgi:hypothetical protein